MNKDVSIVLPFAGLSSLLKTCLDVVRRNTDMSLVLETVIVADKCDDETLGYLNSLYRDGVRLVLNPELVGITRALNLGAKVARGEYIAYMATDIEIVPGWLKALREALDAHPDYGWVGFTHEGGQGFDTGVTMIKRSVLEEISYWDERYADGVGFMDDDLMRKLWQAHYTPHIVPEIVVKHEGRGSLSTLYDEEEESQKFLKNQKLFIEKWGETGTIWENIPTMESDASIARFIGGIGACGGGILRRWLNMHPDVRGIGETGFIACEPLYELSSQSSLKEFSEFLYDHAGNRRIFPLGSREREVLDQCLSRLFSPPDYEYKKKVTNFISAVYAGLASIDGKSMWVEKTPMNAYFANRLVDYFGDRFKLVWIEREPRDNICCIAFSRPWGPNDLLGAIDYWTDNTKCVLHSLAAIPEKLYMRVSYEDFVHNQVAVGKKICEFLEIPWYKNLETPITTDVDIGRYKEEFTLVKPPQPSENGNEEFVWSDRFSWTRNIIDEIVRPRAQIVDIGCNACPITRDLANCTWVDCKSYEDIVEAMKTTQAISYGRDPATKSIVVTGWHPEGSEPIPRGRYVQADAQNLPFEDKQFNLAVVTQLLAYPDDPVAVLKEIRRVAKRAVITVRNEQDWNPKYRTNSDPDARFYTEEMLKQHLEEAGIQTYQYRRLDYDGWSFFAVVTEEENGI